MHQLREDDKGDCQTRTTEGQCREELLGSYVGVEWAYRWEMATFVPDLGTRFGAQALSFLFAFSVHWNGVHPLVPFHDLCAFGSLLEPL